MKCTIEPIEDYESVNLTAKGMKTGCFVVTGNRLQPKFRNSINDILSVNCEFFATWGGCADEAEEIIDDVILDASNLDIPTISMDESIEDAVEFFAHSAFPNEKDLRFIVLFCNDVHDEFASKVISLFKKELVA